MKSCYLGVTAKLGVDRDRWREIDDATIPYSNTGQSTTHSWLVPSSTRSLAYKKKAKLLTPLFRGGIAKFRRDRAISAAR